MNPSRVSPTALKTFDECPRRFAFHYRERPPVVEAASAHLILGNAIHKALGYFSNLPENKRSEKFLLWALRHFWTREKRRDEAFLTEEEERSWGLSAINALSTYWHNHSRGAKAAPNGR